ncbi:hypothetical protein IIA95_04185 [Patescibacteria group bacterium]|nr:hypothetical protein [Patescibacteria group bacterium]
MFRKILRKNRIIAIFIPTALVGIGMFILPNVSGFINFAALKSDGSLEAYADQIIAECSGRSYRPLCYDEKIPELTDVISMEDAFKVTWFVQERDPSYRYCHVLGHELSAREVQKNPADWKNVVTRCPSGMCSNGCLHGGFQERFRVEFFTEEEIQKIKPELADLCEARGNWSPTGLEQASCYHALGHLVMYITNADLKTSTTFCEEIAVKSDGRDYSQVCFDGAFMQIFQPLEPEDFALIEGKQPAKEEVPSFCGRFNGKKKASCLSESWPLFWNELQKPDGLVKFCSMTEEKERSRCYNALFYVLTVQFNLDEKKITAYCSDIHDSIQGRCFANAATRMIETDYRNLKKSIQFCTIARSFGKDDECFNELVKHSTFTFRAGSKEFFELCNNLPQPWNKKCLERN